MIAYRFKILLFALYSDINIKRKKLLKSSQNKELIQEKFIIYTIVIINLRSIIISSRHWPNFFSNVCNWQWIFCYHFRQRWSYIPLHLTPKWVSCHKKLLSLCSIFFIFWIIFIFIFTFTFTFVSLFHFLFVFISLFIFIFSLFPLL